MVAQQTLIGLTDNPGQFREPPLSGIFRQAWRERFGHSDGMKNLLTMPFESVVASAYSSYMRLRLALQPPWVRFLVWAPIAAVLFGGGTSLMSRSIWSTVIAAIFFGVLLAASFTYGTQRMHTALTEAVGGLDQAERSQAIAAVTHGVVPADQKVRSAAVRLGWAYLGGKSADQLKRQERRSWIASAVLVALGIGLAIMDSEQRMYFLVLVLLLLVVLPLGVLRTRRIQRNVALLGEDPISR